MMKITSHSVNDTIKIGRILAKNLGKGDIVCLIGKLGSGKTVLTKGIAAGLGIKKEKIISPTFVLIRQYTSKIPLYHFDLYRIKSPKDILVLGYEEYLYDKGITVIEWADRLRNYLPDECLKVKIAMKGTKTRLLTLETFGERYKEKIKFFDRSFSKE